MNSEAAKLAKRIEAERAQFDTLDEFRTHALDHLRLKTVLKESHCTPLQALASNHAGTTCRNFFASVGKNQATVYDDLYLSDYLSIVVQFENVETEHAPGGDLLAVAWVNSDGACDNAKDSCVAVGGRDNTVSVISTVEAAVRWQLTGHKKPIQALSGASRVPGLLASLSRDGCVKLWDVFEERCIATWTELGDVLSIALHPDGQALVLGKRGGTIHGIDLTGSFPAGAEAPKQLPASFQDGTLPTAAALPLEGEKHRDAVDGIMFAQHPAEGTHRLLSHSADGRIHAWDWASKAQTASWKIPHCERGDGACAMGATADGNVVAAGNSRGDVYVHDARTGERLARVEPGARSATGEPVRACALSADCRHLLVAAGKGFLFRYEYRAPVVEKEDKEAAAAAAGDQPTIEATLAAATEPVAVVEAAA